MIGLGNSNDKKLYVNKSGAMMLIKKTEHNQNKENNINNTQANQYTIMNSFNNNIKNKPGNICSSFRQNNALGVSKLQNTISFGNNNNTLYRPNMSGLYNSKKSGHKKEDITCYYNNNNVLTSANITLL